MLNQVVAENNMIPAAWVLLYAFIGGAARNALALWRGRRFDPVRLEGTENPGRV